MSVVDKRKPASLRVERRGRGRQILLCRAADRLKLAQQGAERKTNHYPALLPFMINPTVSG